MGPLLYYEGQRKKGLEALCFSTKGYAEKRGLCILIYGSIYFSVAVEKVMKVLLVEDDKKIAEFIAKGLKEAGFIVDFVQDGTEGLRLGQSGVYEAAIIDVMLPGLDGLSLIQRLREKGLATPVLILSAKRSVDDRVAGLESGGDDYLTKPFSFSELLARLNALIRRSLQAVEYTVLRVGDLSMNLLTREVERAGVAIELQAKEFNLLQYLMRNAGRVVTKTSILDNVYEYSFDPQTNVVDVLVCRLRNKIDKNFENKMLNTIRGVGYVLKTADGGARK